MSQNQTQLKMLAHWLERAQVVIAVFADDRFLNKMAQYWLNQSDFINLLRNSKNPSQLQKTLCSWPDCKRFGIAAHALGKLKLGDFEQSWENAPKWIDQEAVSDETGRFNWDKFLNWLEENFNTINPNEVSAQPSEGMQVKGEE